MIVAIRNTLRLLFPRIFGCISLIVFGFIFLGVSVIVHDLVSGLFGYDLASLEGV